AIPTTRSSSLDRTHRGISDTATSSNTATGIFIDLPFSPDNTPLVQPEAPNAETQIIMLRVAISSHRTSDDVKSYDVACLIHSVGDVHQPLHATSRFTQGQPKGDRGGNDVKICTGYKQQTRDSAAKRRLDRSGRSHSRQRH